MMRFEQLERRDLLAANLVPTVEGAQSAFKGEEISITVTVTNRGDQTGSAQVWQIWPRQPLDNQIWEIDGLPLSDRLDASIELEPGQNEVFRLTGRIPQDASLSVFLEVGVGQKNVRYFGGQHSTVILDPFVGPHTLEVAFAPDLINGRDGFVFSVNPHSDTILFHSAEHAGDINGDDIDDLFLNYVDLSDINVNGEWARHAALTQFTVLGSREPRLSPRGPGRIDVERRLDGDVVEQVTGQPGVDEFPDHFRWPAHPRDGTGRRYPVGDVNGDGFVDDVRGDPHSLAGGGLATVLFGPDYRDEFVILGTARPDTPGADGNFGLHAGPVGDVNGDGIGDFYVLADYGLVYVFHGRELERDQIGDINRNGRVDVADFLILAANFGKDAASRTDGDLNGDQRVTFEDFLLLAANFGA